eukprot:TRINITY_DN4357_c0_g1_i3.p1 TRINITY_DN4357_c0_g1~~TRINITY_DN4357_c0_g1_i3.p1  ORF type:complete len:406 (+),score=72.92 TRINITY_DN4357_c0_g1_i3:36-1220(+)
MKFVIPSPFAKIIVRPSAAVSVLIKLRDNSFLVGACTIEHWTLLSDTSSTTRFIQKFDAHTNAVKALVELNGVDADDNSEEEDHCFLSGSWDQTVRKWSLRTGQCLFVLQSVFYPINCLLVLKKPSRQLNNNSSSHSCVDHSNVNQICVIGTDNFNIRLWRMNKEEECTLSLSGHTSFVTELLQLANGLVVSGSWDCTIKLWNIPFNGDELSNDYKCQCVFTLKGHTDSVSGLVELPDGILVSCSVDCTIRLWNVESGCCIQTTRRASHQIHAIILLSSYFSSSSSTKQPTIMTGSYNERIVAWSRNGEAVFGCGEAQVVWSLLELPNGVLVSGQNSGEVLLWKLFKMSLVELCCDVLVKTIPIVSLKAVLPSELIDVCLLFDSQQVTTTSYRK